MASFKEHIDVSPICDKLNKSHTYVSTGKYNVNLLFKTECIFMLESALVFNNDVPLYLKRKFLEDSFSNMAGQGILITKQKLLATLNRKENEYLSKPIKSYIFLSSLSIEYNSKLKARKLNNTLITFSSKVNKKLLNQNIEDDIKQRNHIHFPDHYTICRAYIKARSEFEAYEKAINSIDLLRGYYNFALNRRLIRSLRSGSYSSTPINKIRLGPIHTLHYTNLSTIDNDTFWYEPDYYYAVTDNINWEEINRSYKKINKLEKKANHEYRCFLQNAITRYARALDPNDQNQCFLKLWALLEYITGTSEYETLIKRVIALYKNDDYHKNCLKCLKETRNRYVHVSTTDEKDLYYMTFQLKGYFEKVYLFHLNKSNLINNQKEAFTILDRASNMQKLKDDALLNNKVLKIFDL